MQVEETLQCVPNIRIVIENTNDFSLVGHDAEMPQALLARVGEENGLVFH